MMVILSVAALVCGVLAGTLDVLPGALDFLSKHTGAVLYVLMFSVGISVGLHRGLLQELRRHHVKILIIPLPTYFTHHFIKCYFTKWDYTSKACQSTQMTHIYTKGLITQNLWLFLFFLLFFNTIKFQDIRLVHCILFLLP